MKTMRKVVAIAIALLMALLTSTIALAVPAEGSITIADPNGGATYKAYKIFDLTVDNQGNITYTIDSSSPWHAVLFDNDHNSLFSGIEGDHSTTPHTITKMEGFSAENLSDFLLENGIEAGEVTTDDGSVAGNANPATIDDLDPGYYLITTTLSNQVQPKAALTNVLPGEEVTVQDKNDMPFDKTVDDVKEEPVHIGQTLDFQIDGKVPTVASTDTSFTYIITDTMDEGLTFDSSSLVVKIDGSPVSLFEVSNPATPLTGDQIRFGQNDKTFEISLEMFNRGQNENLQGKDITITYQATVNENAAATISVNTAILEYGNDPQHLLSKDSQTAVYTAKIVIDKYETGAPEQKVKGAEFILTKDDGNGGTLYYKATLDNDNKVTNVTWSANEADATKRTTDTNGRAEFRGIEAGTYYLIETQAPTGYTQLTAPVEVVVSTTGVTDVSLTADQVSILLTNTAHISNTPGSMMPSTGGIGRTIFFALAGVLAADVVIRVLRSRRSAE